MRLNFSALKKIAFGFMTGAAVMVWDAGSHYIIYCFTPLLSLNYLQLVMQHYIYKTNPCSDNLSSCDTVSSLFTWIQIGS